MARNTGFKLRLKVATYLLLGKVNKDMRTMTCGRCGSMDIVEIEEENESTEKYKVDSSSRTRYFWSDKVKCKLCGAKCIEIQTWEWED